MRPNANAITRHQTETQQGAGELVGVGLQLCVGVAQALMPAYQRLMVGLAPHHGVKKRAQGLFDEGCVGGTGVVAIQQRMSRTGCGCH